MTYKEKSKPIIIEEQELCHIITKLCEIQMKCEKIKDLIEKL